MRRYQYYNRNTSVCKGLFAIFFALPKNPLPIREVNMETLISNVATKGGCTRVGVDVMEEKNIDKILQEVISKTSQKAQELGK